MGNVVYQISQSILIFKTLNVLLDYLIISYFLLFPWSTFVTIGD